MNVQTIKIKDLYQADYNPRVMGEEELAKLVRSIREFGFLEPVVVNQYSGRENVIVGGHQRVVAAQMAGIDEVPVVFVNLPPNKEKVLNLALNRIQGSWDDKKLAEILKELNKDSADIFLTGFDGTEIDDLLKDFNEKKEDDFDVDKEIAEIKEPESRLGEIYQLGPHRLICGDSTTSDVEKLLNGESVDMVFTDPPYNVGYKSRGKNRSKWAEAYGDDDYNEKEFEQFCVSAFTNFAQYLKKGGAYYICSGWSSWSAFWRALLKINLKPRGCIIWDKGHGGMGWSDYWYQHELVVTGFNFDFKDEDDEIYEMVAYGFNDQVKHYFAKRGGARTSDVWRIPRDSRQSYEHPTQKPTKLIENALYNSSKPGEKILDLFGGSGSTLIACEKIRKRYARFNK